MWSWKKIVYVSSFVLLGFLAQLIVHALGEMAYIGLLLEDTAFWSFGLSYSQLLAVHGVWTAVLTVAGVCIGYQQGMRWWMRVYDE